MQSIKVSILIVRKIPKYFKINDTLTYNDTLVKCGKATYIYI